MSTVQTVQAVKAVKSRFAVATKSKIAFSTAPKQIKFTFSNNKYVADIPYGLEMVATAIVVLSESRRTGCIIEEVYLTLPGLLHGHTMNSTFFMPSDPEFIKYSEWDIVLCPMLTEHLMTVVDKLIDSFETEVYRQRRNARRSKRSTQ